MICALSMPLSAAQLYQWKDENGVVHFTDKPPKGKNATKMRVKSPPLSGNEGEKQGTKTAPPNANAQRCETERKRLDVLQSNMTVRMRNDDGTMRELNPEEMQQEIGFSQAAIERYCAPGTDSQLNKS